MRNLAVALLASVSIMGCATSVGPDRPYSAHSNVGASETQLPTDLQDGASGDTKADSRESHEHSAKDAAKRISRTLSCGVKGALAGLGLGLFTLLSTPYPQGGSLYVIPLAASAGALVGLAMGAVGGEGGFCSLTL